MKKTLLLLLIAIITIVSSCKKNEVTTTPDPIVPFDNAKTITTVVAGKVTAQDGTALNNVEITIGTSTTVTDINGNFIIPKATLSEKAGFIKATKAGYFDGSRTIIAKEKVVNNVVIQLVKKTTSGDFTNANGGTITVATGGSVAFPANAVVTKSGAAYSGTVKVSAYFLDPTSASCNKEMPGDLRGINTSNDEQVLASYGMMAVELNGSNGEPLQLAAGKSATLSFPIASSLQGNSPETIPLWFFDETKGMWIEQGSATKTGNTYVGTVSHFTWWNCDYGGGPITYTATFVDQNGNPLSNYHVYFITTTGWGGGGGHGWTASDGSLTGNIPANTPIIIKVVGYCGNTPTTLYTATVGPFTQNTNAGTITVTLANTITTTTIKGNVVDCNNAAVANGYALIKFNNNYYYTNIANGLFSKTITTCGTSPTGTATIDAFDLSTLKKNNTLSTVNITGSGTFNIGQIAACGVQTAVHYTATFVDQNSNSILFNSIYVSFSSDSGISNTIYAPNNDINVILPANKIITRKVYAYNICGAYTVDSTQIGPFATDFNAGIISIAIPQGNYFTISGTANTCNNIPIDSGLAMITIGANGFSRIIRNGNFTVPITRCNTNSATASITITDFVNHQQNSTPITVTVSNANVNIGTVQACGTTVNEFINYKFDGITYNADSLKIHAQGGGTYIIQGFLLNKLTKIEASFNALSIGSCPMHIDLFLPTETYLVQSGFVTVNASITEYGNIGQFISGTFIGNLLKSGGTTVKPISGSFRIKRTQ